MTKQEFDRVRAVQPFQPFRILTADGNHYDVRHPENFAISGNGRLLAIGMPDDSFVTLDILLITAVQRPIPHKRNGARRRPRS
jgi:hypothetical protein